MDIRKEYEKAINVKCPICNEKITKEQIEINNIIATITKRKTKNFAHKTCLFGR